MFFDRSALVGAALVAAVALVLAGCSGEETQQASAGGTAELPFGEAAAAQPPQDKAVETHDPDPREVHFSELRMLTTAGENAEAYFSFGGDRLVFQATRPGLYECDQILTMNIDGSNEQLVSTGRGRTTCGYFLPGDEQIVYASTHSAMNDCPPPVDRSQGYVWPVYSSMDIYRTTDDPANPDLLISAPGYDAEPTVSPNGDKIVFTSLRDGDLEIYIADIDGANQKRLTNTPGYDGGPFFSPDGSKIVYRASRPEGDALKDYMRLLGKGLVRPSDLDIWVMDADGSNQRKVTDLGKAAFAPFFHPSGEKILFSTNHHSESGREFDIFMVDIDGSNLEQVTFSEGFDGFPMFSPDGKYLVFGSNRHNKSPRDTNVFITEWKD